MPDAYELGYNAYVRGKSLEDNPYQPDSKEFYEWLDGRETAKQDHQNEQFDREYYRL